MSATETSAGGLPRRRVPLLEVLSQGDLDAIHAETLKVLEQTGVFVEDGEALDIFSDGGAMVEILKIDGL